MPHSASTTPFHTATASSDRWAHDIRNTLATVGLHLETLERLSGSRGREIATAAHALMSRAAAMCNAVMSQGAPASQRRGFDLTRTIVQLANLLRPTAPEGFEIRVAGNGAFVAFADPQDVFRILFNLVHNAIAVARQGRGGRRPISHVTLLIDRQDATVTVRIADDGPGLPQAVRANLFRRQKSGGRGLGLSIARELAEKNGGMLQLVPSAVGASFVLELPAAGSAAAADQGALRSLGRRIEH